MGKVEYFLIFSAKPVGRRKKKIDAVAQRSMEMKVSGITYFFLLCSQPAIPGSIPQPPCGNHSVQL